MIKLGFAMALDNEICSSLCDSLEKSPLSWQSGIQNTMTIDTKYWHLVLNFKLLRFYDNVINSTNQILI